MKIVCSSCGAKYSIADEKVAGKVFKIRCKKCSAVIVVKGDEQAGAAADAGAGGGDAVWHVVVSGDQQGPFSPGQIGEMLTAGTIDWEAFVWREGFDGWQPARDVEELVQAVSGGGQESGGGMGADPFAADGGGGFGGDAPAASKGGGRGGDLFAGADAGASAFGGGDDDDDGVVASAPSPRVSKEAAQMTGTRNENSVLFSLANLQALATGSPGGGGGAAAAPAAAAPKAGMATGEGSGLIDIRALASATAASGGIGGGMSSGGGGGRKDAVDDLLAIGAGPSPFAAPALAPIAPPKPERSGGGGMIGIGLGAVALLAVLGIGAYVVTRPPPQPQVIVQQAPAAPLPVVAAGAAPPAAATPAPGTPAAPAAGTPAAPAAPGAQAAAPAPSGDRPRSPRGGGGRDRGSDSPAAPAAPERPSAGGNDTPAARPVARPAAGGNSDIDELLNGALNGNKRPPAGRPAPAEPAGGGGGADLPSTPSRDQVMAAMRGVTPAVQACGNGAHGVATATVIVANSGRVSNATVNLGGGLTDAAVGSCVARAVRGASFPRFSTATFRFDYPFRL